MLDVVLHFKGFLIENQNSKSRFKNRFFYTFPNIRISEMLPESFIDKFLKLLIQV